MRDCEGRALRTCTNPHRLYAILWVQEKRETIGRTPFTTRLQNAIAKQQAERQQLYDRFYGVPQQEICAKDLQQVAQFFMNYSGEAGLPENDEERHEKLNDMLEDAQVRCASVGIALRTMVASCWTNCQTSNW
jgi:hypothetical protein